MGLDRQRDKEKEGWEQGLVRDGRGGGGGVLEGTEH